MLLRRENAAFISPANSSVISEEGWRERERKESKRTEEKGRENRQQRGGGVAEVVCSTRIKQTELVPCEKKRQIKKTDVHH